MEILFLGTSAGAPTKTRNVSGVAVKRKGGKSWYLVDCGEGTQHRLLYTPLSLSALKAVFITHIHGDHCYGLPGLLASATLSSRKEPLQIFGPAVLQQFIETVRDMTQMRLSYELQFTAIDDACEALAVQDFMVHVVPLSHRVPSYAYAFVEKFIERKLDVQKLTAAGIAPGPLWKQLRDGENIYLADGTLICGKEFLLDGRAPRKIIVCGDNDDPQLLRDSCCDADVLIHEATFTAEVAAKVGKGPQHTSAAMIAAFAESAAVKNLVLTHFSARYRDDISTPPSIKNIEDEARSYYQGNLFIANDFDRFFLNREHHLDKIAAGRSLITA